MVYALLGVVTLVVVVVWYLRHVKYRIEGAANLRCPECGGDLRGYEESFSCPHCYATLGEEEFDHEDDQTEPDYDVVEEEDDEDEGEPIA